MEEQVRRLQQVVDEHTAELKQLRKEHEDLKAAQAQLLPLGGTSPTERPAPAKEARQFPGGARPAADVVAAASLDPSVVASATAQSTGGPAPRPGAPGGKQLPDLYLAAKPLVQPQRTKDARSQEKSRQAVEAAIRSGASVNEWTGPGNPLSGAVASRSAAFLELLLQARAVPDNVDDKGVSALHTAAFGGDAQICKALLGARASVNMPDPHEQTPLFFAPTRAVCETLFRAHADVNAINTRGQSPLHLAAMAGLGDSVLWLASRQTRAVICLRDSQGKLAEDYTLESGCRSEAIDALRQASGNSAGGGATTRRREQVKPQLQALLGRSPGGEANLNGSAALAGTGLSGRGRGLNATLDLTARSITPPRAAAIALMPGEDGDDDFFGST